MRNGAVGDHELTFGLDLALQPGPKVMKYFLGTGDDDTLRGDPNQQNTIKGYAGDDRLIGGNLNDHMDGGSGNDELYGGLGADALIGNAGNDRLFGGDGNDQIYTGTGSDYVNAGEGNDQIILRQSRVSDVLTIYGAGGNDAVSPGAGAEYVNGGAGDEDFVEFQQAPSGVHVDLASGVGELGWAEGDRYVSIELAYGSAYDDVFAGTSGVNFLAGRAGDDVLQGRGGGDYLYGEEGSDTVSYADSAAGVTVNLNTGLASGGDATGDTINSCERVIGTAFHDFLAAAAAGSDLLGGGANDTLVGNDGNDRLYGSAGNDLLAGARGADLLVGGAGQDFFLFRDVRDSTATADGRDTIHDFSHAQADKVNLKDIDANTTVAGNQSFIFIGAAAFTHHAGELRYAAQNGNVFVYGDTNGDGAADLSIRLSNLTAIQAGDFTL